MTTDPSMTAITPAQAEQPVLRLCAVSKTYGAGHAVRTALSDVSLEIRRGAFVALVGDSGSGKSTVLNIAGGLERPTTGSVHLVGRDISEIPTSAVTAHRARTVSYIFQEWNLIRTMTVLENVSLALELVGTPRRQAAARALAALDLVGVGRHRRKFPDQLSGGEQQRVAIARALADRRPVLLADEPTGALDSRNGEIVVDLVRRLAADGVACVVATHNPQIADAADEVIRLHDGRIVSGEPIG